MTLRALTIAGPTASGKTRLAVDLAHRLGSEIISADSRQVYRGLDLGTGKDLGEYARFEPPIPYHLIDIADPRELYSLYRYQRDCYRVLRAKSREERYGSGEVPLLLVGGTGLYIEAVIRGYEIADVPEDPGLRRRLGGLPRAELIAILRRQAPDLVARTDTSSTKRLVRALEIAEARGRAPVAMSEPLGVPVAWRVFVLRIEREVLRRRIRERLLERLADGMVEEVKGLIDRGVPVERLNMLGLEYREITAFLQGRSSYEGMVETLSYRIGQLAKRQETYFRGLSRRGIPVTWIGPRDGAVVLRAAAS